MTHYETLGVDRTASADDIKKAYRKLASAHHPDKGGDTKKFQEIQAAYATLEDAAKRARYDQELAGGHRQFNFNTGNTDFTDSGMGNMDDILNHLHRQFGFGFRGGPDPFSQFNQANQRRQPRNRDVRITVPLNLIDTLTEQTKTINLTLPGNMKETVQLNIPRGISSGATIRYAGLGDYSTPNAPRADLYVQFHVNTMHDFERVGIDLVTHLTINCLEAITGCEKDVKGIEDKTFKIVIPPGTQFGARFGIPEQGVYSTDHPGRGRLIVAIEIYIPKELTDSQIETIREINATL